MSGNVLTDSDLSRPLCVDMDGTLLKVDTTEELTIAFLRDHPWQAWRLIGWMLKGRPHLKHQLTLHAQLDIPLLPVNEEFLEFLKAEKARGRTLVLASAADEKMVQAVAERFSLFSKVIGSDGKTNRRSAAKREYLTQLYGPRGFDYAGNSSADYAVWEGVAKAIVVNARPAVEKRAREIAKVTQVFPSRLALLPQVEKVLQSPDQSRGLLGTLMAMFVMHLSRRNPQHWLGEWITLICLFCTLSCVNFGCELFKFESHRKANAVKHPFAEGNLSPLRGLAWMAGFGIAAWLSVGFLPWICSICLAGIFLLEFLAIRVPAQKKVLRRSIQFEVFLLGTMLVYSALFLL